MPHYYHFNQLCILLRFTDEQISTLSQNLTYDACPKPNLHNALTILYNHKITKTLAPEIASACVDSVISEFKHPEDLALIICEFATAEVFSTINKTHTHLTRIASYPNKKGLHVALTWLNSLGLPNEMIQYYFLPDGNIQVPNYRHVIFKQIETCLRMIIQADTKHVNAVTSLVTLLKHAYSLPYDNHIKFIHTIELLHNRVN